MSRPSLDEQKLFTEHGWLVLRNIISAQDLIPLAQVFDQLTVSVVNELARDEHGRSIWQVVGVCSRNELMLGHLRDGLGEFTADLLSVDRIQLLQDTLLVKPAHIGASIELHQDHTYTGFLEPPNAVSIRLSLTESSIESGCMYVIDRSHRWQHQGNMSLFSDRLQQDVVEKLPAELRALVEKDRIPIELNPGDVSIHHCLTYHGSYENSTGRVQKTIVTHVFDGDCRLKHERLPSNAVHLFHTDIEGHLLPSSFPLLFERQNSCVHE